MKRSVELTLLVIACCALLCAARGQDPVDDSAEQEWRIRALALDSGRIELASNGTWTEKCARLEALRRRLELGRDERLAAEDQLQLTELLVHAAPNVRAAALSCLELAEFAEWDAAIIANLARDPLPEVRTKLCLAVPAKAWSENLAILERLARSDDEGVRSAARLALFGLDPHCAGGEEGEAAASAQAKLLEQVLRSDGVRAYLFEIERWSRVRRGTESRFPVRDAERLFRELDESGKALRAVRALWLVANASALDVSAAKVVAEGWGLPLDPAWDSAHRAQRRLMLSAARRSGEVLAVKLLAAIERSSRAEPSIERELALESLFEGVLEAESTSWILPRLQELQLDEVELITFWSVADTSETHFEPAMLEVWLAAGHTPELRVLVADILVSVFARTQDSGALSALVRLLQDAEPEVRQIAIRGLAAASAEIVNAIGLEFFEAWERLDEAERFMFLRRLPRERSLTAFRSSLLELGGVTSLRRAHPSILELLGKFEGDAECAVHLSVWLKEDAEFIAKKPSAPEFLQVEIAARGGVRALHSVSGAQATPQLESVLSLTLQLSMDVAKTCAWCLGRTPSGLAALEPYMQAEVPTRVRVEAALALARRGEGPARDRANSVLVERYAACDDELRGRILSVFAATAADVGRDLAHLLFTDAGSSYGEAAQALEVLRACFELDPSDANFVLFAGYIELAQTQETRRLVIEALGERRDPRIRGQLEERLSRGPHVLGAERQELLVALARVAPESSLLWSELWRLPVESARARLEERFRGKISAAVAFSFRGEIEALQVISSADAWPAKQLVELSRLDGQLALALAEACRAGGDDEHATRLERAALVALAGELPNEKARLAGLRARARLWASAEVAGRNSETAYLAERLCADWADGSISERDLETLFGAFDPEQGWDPLARLRTSALQAHARVAASTGDLERARQLLVEARGQLGYSAAAREQQAALERDLR